MPEAGGATRDLRIDFFRGVALYMIIVDHIPGDPLSRLTYGRFGFSDAAEVFVFLSGVSCGIVYSRILLRQYLGGLIKAVTRRSLQIYFYYLIANLITILFIVCTRDAVAIPPNHQAFIVLREAPLGAIWSAILLVSPPELPGILVLYLELTLLIIPTFLLIATYNRMLALTLSASMWCLSQIFPELLPRLADHSYFNPMAWQFLFCIGMLLGISYGDQEPLLDRFRTRSWVLLAWSVVGLGLAFKLAQLAVHAHLAPVTFTLSDATLSRMKETLAPVRLAHFLSVAFLVSTYVKADNSMFRTPIAGALIKSGRCSLQVFCLGALVSVALNLLVAIEAVSIFDRLIMDGAALVLVALTAIRLSHWTGGNAIPVRR
jgi:hypothetical protein